MTAGGWVLVVGALPLGCSELSGLEDYTVVEHSAPVKFLDGPECNACLEAKCEKNLTTCAGDELCTGLLSERRECNDPSCHGRVVYDLGVHEVAWKQKAWATEFRELYTCARDSCRAECSVGRSWSCIGSYSWEVPATGPRTLWHRVVHRENNLGVDGVTVRACSRADPHCSSPLGAPTQTGDGGFAELEITGGDYEVYLRVEPDPATFPAFVAFGALRPRLTRELSESPVAQTALLEELAINMGKKRDSALASVWVEIRDCDGFGGDDVSFEAWHYEGGERRPCGSCYTTYQKDFYKPDPDAVATDPDGPMASINNLEPVLTKLEARARSTGELLARTEILLEAGQVYYAVLYPLTVAEGK